MKNQIDELMQSAQQWANACFERGLNNPERSEMTEAAERRFREKLEHALKPCAEPVTYWDLSEEEFPVRPSKYDAEEHPNHVPLYLKAAIQHEPLPHTTSRPLTQTEMKIFKLGWLECEAAHGIGKNQG